MLWYFRYLSCYISRDHQKLEMVSTLGDVVPVSPGAGLSEGSSKARGPRATWGSQAQNRGIPGKPVGNHDKSWGTIWNHQVWGPGSFRPSLMITVQVRLGNLMCFWRLLGLKHWALLWLLSGHSSQRGWAIWKVLCLRLICCLAHWWRFGKTVEVCVSALWELNLEAVRCIWPIFDHVSLLFIMFKLKIIFWVSRWLLGHRHFDRKPLEIPCVESVEWLLQVLLQMLSLEPSRPWPSSWWGGRDYDGYERLDIYISWHTHIHIYNPFLVQKGLSDCMVLLV